MSGEIYPKMEITFGNQLNVLFSCYPRFYLLSNYPYTPLKLPPLFINKKEI